MPRIAQQVIGQLVLPREAFRVAGSASPGSPLSRRGVNSRSES
ncbi:hypothetical protein [Paenibacillus mucilaginosus]|nr:hypothetical protein [Paenibacillus mucilaginosus]